MDMRFVTGSSSQRKIETAEKAMIPLADILAIKSQDHQLLAPAELVQWWQALARTHPEHVVMARVPGTGDVALYMVSISHGQRRVRTSSLWVAGVDCDE